MIEIIKTPEQAAEERKQRQEASKKMMEEIVCPYCKDYARVCWRLENSSVTNARIAFLVAIGATKDKQRRVYECKKCGAMWNGEWYE